MQPYYQLPVSQMRRFGFALMLPAALLGALAFPTQVQTATAQTSGENRPLTIRSDVQEYNANTQVITARGNVQMLYPARQLQATASFRHSISTKNVGSISVATFIFYNRGSIVSVRRK